MTPRHPPTPIVYQEMRAALGPIAPVKSRTDRANYDAAVASCCAIYRMPLPVGEHTFAPPRRWRFDYAWKDKLIALEVEGGVFTGGRHTRGAGFKDDMEKYNTATAGGWRVIRAMPDQIHNGEAFALIAGMMGLEPIEGLR